MYPTKNKEWAGTRFQLRPFAAGATTEKLHLYGCLSRRYGAIQIEYKVEGTLDDICWQSNFHVKGRCHELWRQTCFELFFGIKGDSTYWEVNLSPGGCWNIYYFTNYRTGMREERAVGQPVCHVVRGGDHLSLACTLDFNGLIDDFSDLEVGISSVLQTIDGSVSYWALDHHGRKPDFHNRKSFSVVLPGAEEFKTMKRSLR